MPPGVHLHIPEESLHFEDLKWDFTHESLLFSSTCLQSIFCGHFVLARAALWWLCAVLVVCSTWVMMHRKTRKLSKMPEEVRTEISPYFLDRSAIKHESMLTQKIIRLDGNAEFVRSGLTVSLFSIGWTSSVVHLICCVWYHLVLEQFVASDSDNI